MLTLEQLLLLFFGTSAHTYNNTLSCPTNWTMLAGLF